MESRYVYAFCCLPCAYGSNVQLMEPTVCCGGNCYGGCCAYYLLSGLGCCCFIHMMARGYIRNKYNIQGDCCTDCMITYCCAPCALCQERREMLIHGHVIGGPRPAPPPAAAAPPQQQVIVMMPGGAGLMPQQQVVMPMPPPVQPGYPGQQPSSGVIPPPAQAGYIPGPSTPDGIVQGVPAVKVG